MHHGDIRVTMSVYGEPVNDVFKDASSKNCRAGSQSVTDKSVAKLFKSGVGNGNRTRNRRSHSPVLCQLSYSHRHADYTTAIPCCQKRQASPSGDGASLPRLGRTIQSSAKNRHHMELSIGTSREKGQQNKVREKPSRTFERKKQARAYDVTRSCCAPGSKTAVGLTRAPHPRIQIPWRASAPSPEDSWCRR